MFSNGGSASHAAGVTSVYERVLGDEFAALDPRLRTYFGPIPEGFVGVGSGVYRSAGLRVRVLRPLFALLSRWGIAFAEFGEDVPFTVRNFGQPDGSLSAVRTFEFARVTRTMSDSMQCVDGRLVDRVGVRGELEVELSVHVVAGRLRMQSGRLALRLFGRRVPLPPTVRVTLTEEARADGTQHVDVRMHAPLLGDIYGYSGAFTYHLAPDGVA